MNGRPTSWPDQWYETRWRTLIRDPDKDADIRYRASFVLQGRHRYEASETVKIPWFVTGIIHMREAADEDDPWLRSIRNGMPWSERNTFSVPQAGPFSSWEDDMLDAMAFKHQEMTSCGELTDVWTIASISRFFDRWNGWYKYAKLNVPSPYLYAFSNHGHGVGKYKRVKVHPDGRREIVPQVANGDAIDFVYVPDAVNYQCGAVTCLHWLVEHGHVPCPTSVLFEEL